MEASCPRCGASNWPCAAGGSARPGRRLHLNFEREIGEVLGIPDTVTQVALLPVAYYTGDDFQSARRRPVEQVTYWNEWKTTEAP